MGIIETIGIIGSIASVSGAIYAWHQANKSKESATMAVKVKTELLNYRKASELAELKPVIIAARDAMDKYCTSSSEGLSGVNKDDDAKTIQKAKNSVSEFSSHFSTEIISSFNKSIDRELQKFVESDDSATIKKCGRNMHREISTLYSLLVERLKQQQESTVN